MSSMNNNNNVQLSPLRASDIQLTVYSEPIQNDTERILTSTCEWIKIHKPALILSLLDPYRSFYVAMIAQQSLIPFISMTQNYQNEINPITPSSSSSLTITKNEEKEEEAKLDNDQRFPQNINQNYWLPPPPSSSSSSLRLSLDPPIQTLADATFKLLRTQYWFDALLIIDESIVSDQFARRLTSLCDSFRYEYEQQHLIIIIIIMMVMVMESSIPEKNFYQNDLAMNPFILHHHHHPSSESQYDTFDWMELKRSSIKKSAMLADTLLHKPIETITTTTTTTTSTPKSSTMADTDKDTTTFFTKQDDDDDDDDVKSESIFEQQQQQQQQSLKYDRIIRRRGIKSKKPSSAKQQQEIRQLKAGLLMSIWKNLMIIRVSKSLPQKEFYLRMAEIQTTHRRIVLVHCDKRTMKRVIHNGRELDLFNGEKIWILLDGRLGPDEKFDTISSSSSSSWFNGDGDGVNGKQDDDHHMDSVNDNDQLPLPVGMLAIQNRHRKIYDPELLDSIVELMGKAALNSYQLRLLQKQYPKSRTLFQNQKQINNNNNNNIIIKRNPSVIIHQVPLNHHHHHYR
nr:uncharacterized protein LOC124491120 [Dermatophagoides farinae]